MKYFAAALFAATVLAGPAITAHSQPSVAPAVEQPAGAAQRDPKRLSCNEHEAYEDQCFICHPELREKGRLWCQEHARYEDRCFICHPELRDASRPFCEKHFLYEDECHLCRPELKMSAAKAESSADAKAASSNTEDKQLMCKEHGVPEADCGICHPNRAASLKDGEGLKVRFASPEAAEKAGIQTAKPEVGGIAGGIECYAEITFNQNKLAEIASPVAGRIAHVDVNLGDQVAMGARLATVASPEMAEAVNAERLARQTLERERRLYAQRVSARKDLEAAESAYETARQRLEAFGVSNAHAEGDDARRAGDVLELRAPFAGEVVERSAVQGSLVEPATALFLLADRSTMWAELNIPEADLVSVRVGQPVEVVLDVVPGRVFAGRLTWVAAQVDERTRMARALAELPNPDGSLRAGAFARARVVTVPAEGVVTVPRSAIQDVDGNSIAFVKLEDDLYEARAVRLGAKNADRVSVEGVTADEDVVVAHSFLVKSQLQISRLGAGCTD